MTNQLLDDPLLRDLPVVRGHKVLGPCLLLEPIGEGGMASVYRAVHLNLGVDAAVKIVAPHRVATDPTFLERFRREARSAARLNHQNVVRVFDVEEACDLNYLIMEYVAGEDAQQRVARKGALPTPEALRIVHDACLGLATAHREGIVHRDIKPGNLLISNRGDVKVGDLGLARPENVHPDSMVSMAGVAVGTPAFMPPEQWEGAVSPATDVWAMGSTLFYLLTAKPAFQGDSVLTLMQRITSEPFPDLSSALPDAHPDLVALLARATATAPAERFANAQELAHAIAALPITLPSLEHADDLAAAKTLSTTPSRAWLDEVRAMAMNPSEAATIASDAPATEQQTPAVAVDPDGDVAKLRRLLGLALLSVILTVAVGAVGGWMVWDAHAGGPIAGWQVLSPTVAGCLLFFGPLYFVRRRWFPDKERLQAAARSLGQRSPNK